MKYFVLNTNKKFNPLDEESMLSEEIAAAYFEPQKSEIDKLSIGDIVFLYSVESGIVASGKVCSERKTKDYREKCPDEMYYRDLEDFNSFIDNPISASEMKQISGNNFSFQSTMFEISSRAGSSILDVCKNRAIESLKLVS